MLSNYQAKLNFETGKETNQWCKMLWNDINPGGKLIVGMNDSPDNHYDNKGTMVVEMRLMVDSEKKRKRLFPSKESKSFNMSKDIKKIKCT